MNGIWEQLLFLTPGWGDLFEILIVGALFYWLLLLVQRTRAMQMLLGLFFVAGTYFVSRLLNLTIVQSLMETIVQYGAIAAIVVFQPELRSALAQLGQSRMIRIFTKLEKSQVVDEILEAVEGLAHSGTGAILVIEQEMGLDEYAESGTPVGATVSAELLATIFTPQSPLHDGAVIIAGDMIRVARAILPLTQFPIDDRSLGTRHRAALGLSEETDALVIVVSEETARVSVVHRGQLESGVELARLRELLTGALPVARAL